MPILMTSMPKQKKLCKKELSTNQMGLKVLWKVLWRVVDAVKVVEKREENQRKENHVEEEAGVEEDELLT